MIPVLHSVAEANASDESDVVAMQEDEQIGIFQILDILEEAVDALLTKSSSLSHPQLKARTKQIKPHHCTQCSLQLLPMFKVICPFICVASAFKNSFWGETSQLLPVFKVVHQFIWIESTFNNSFWGETVQLLTVLKVICL